MKLEIMKLIPLKIFIWLVMDILKMIHGNWNVFLKQPLERKLLMVVHD